MRKFANAVLKDGKIMFWWSGDECYSIYDFYKDFYYAGLNMTEELKTGKYSLVKTPIDEIGRDDVEFYRKYELHEDYKGANPHQYPDREMVTIVRRFVEPSGN